MCKGTADHGRYEKTAGIIYADYRSQCRNSPDRIQKDTIRKAGKKWLYFEGYKETACRIALLSGKSDELE